MKFKLESNSTVQDLVVEDIASVEALMNALDTSSLDQAFEELNDLQMLQQNIEKFGITEPVMDLVGGTLQSMNIHIDDKDACLEDLKETAKQVGKKIWEIVLKIFRKIMEFLNADAFSGMERKINKLRERATLVAEGHFLPSTPIPWDLTNDDTLVISLKEFNSIAALADNFYLSGDNNRIFNEKALAGICRIDRIGGIEFVNKTMTVGELASQFKDCDKLLELALRQVDFLRMFKTTAEKFEKAAASFAKLQGKYVGKLPTANHLEVDVAGRFRIAANVMTKLVARLMKSINRSCEFVHMRINMVESDPYRNKK